jgi:hypothetical protein
MLPHYIPLPHRFLQPWMKLSKCTIKTPVRSDISAPLAEFQRGWPDMPSPRPGHVWVSEGIDLLIYRPISAGFHPPTSISWLVDPPLRTPLESDRFSPCRHGFLWLPTCPHAPPDLSAQSSITVRFRPVFAPPPLISALTDQLRLIS